MLVEFIGCTGSGKTTLITPVIQRLSNSQNVLLSSTHSVPTICRISHPMIGNLVNDTIGFPFYVRHFGKHKAFSRLFLVSLLHYTTSAFSFLNRCRAVARKVGNYEFLRKIEKNQIVLIDEGTIQTAHYIFVYSDKCIKPNDLLHFSKLTPMPDVIIYVKAPIEFLIERTLKRNDPTRTIKSKPIETIEAYLGRASFVFDRLVEAQVIRERMLIIENAGSSPSEIQASSELISKFILDIYNRYGENSPNEL